MDTAFYIAPSFPLSAKQALPGVRTATVIYAGGETASVSGTTIKPFQPSIP